MYRIEQITLTPFESKEKLSEKICRKLKMDDSKKVLITNLKIVKESIDARRKNDIKLVYTLDFDFPEKLHLQQAKSVEYKWVNKNRKSLDRPVIVGFGPAGIFAALILAQSGYNPIVLERGKKVDERSKDVENFWREGTLNPESNVQFGEGGAGTFSDGKLTTGIKDFRIRKVLSELHKRGASEEILYKQKPHIGTDKLREIIENIREEIIKLGGEVRFSTRAENIILDAEKERIVGIEAVKTDDESTLNDGNSAKENSYVIYTDTAVFATGHSARDTYRMLNRAGVIMEQKPMSMGIRVEHPQRFINEAQYGNEKIAEILGPAEYKLNCRTQSDRGVYTFCMCPGGEVIMSASQPGCLVSNGMSYSARSGEYANSGLLVDVRTEDYPSKDVLAGIDFQEKYEKMAYEKSGGYRLLETTWNGFKNSDLWEVLPEFIRESILEAMPILGRKLKGFDNPKTVFKGIETRSSSPVRIVRNEQLESNISGLYTAGEGAGYAGGIMSAGVDGIKVAEKIIESED